MKFIQANKSHLTHTNVVPLQIDIVAHPFSPPDKALPTKYLHLPLLLVVVVVMLTMDWLM